jgi:hypothetical protein
MRLSIALRADARGGNCGRAFVLAVGVSLTGGTSARHTHHTSAGDPSMSQTFEFYDARANEAVAEAENATLDNVRDRNLRAAKTWRALADQARKVMVDRVKAEKIRAERRADEAEAAQAKALANEATAAQY